MFTFCAPRKETTLIKGGMKQERSISSPWRFPLPETGVPVPDYFGYNVFDHRAMKNYVSGEALDNFKKLDDGEPLSEELADALAKGILTWATERGVTHFCHWFQPLTDVPAGKHDTFLHMDKDRPINKFKGKDLIKSEGDGSSVPSGGLRETHAARGYTVWDPKSPPFVVNNGNGATLVIPTVLVSWKNNQALDFKIPLIKSSEALNREGLRFFKLIGDTKHTKLFTNCGLEQEYFLIKHEYYAKRLDLQVCGRTLCGVAPPKKQELSDSYFGRLSDKFLDAIHEVEVEMFKLGVTMQTRHHEVAPGQYEAVAKFDRASLSIDRNLVLMQIMRTISQKHGLMPLFHEVPFKGLNGSGKHNNWSFGTDEISSLLTPTEEDPLKDNYFLFFMACILRGVDRHPDLIRIGISGASNDHRLGGHEAPPSIISVDIGHQLWDLIQKFIAGEEKSEKKDLKADLEISYFPKIEKDEDDRNRTAPMALSGAKFEVRALGASHNGSRLNTILNTIFAESIHDLTSKVEAELKSDKPSGKLNFLKSKEPPSKDEAIRKVAREALKEHQRIVYNGNCYSEEWKSEAKKRGLPNFETTPEALAEFDKKENIELFSKLKILSAEEIKARRQIYEEEYYNKIVIEGRTLRQMTSTQILPAALRYVAEVGKVVDILKDSKEIGRALKNLSSTIDAVYQGLETLDGLLGKEIYSASETEKKKEEEAKSAKLKTSSDKANFALKNILPALDKLRESIDKLEQIVAADKWPLPTYFQMLYDQE